jgi:hypothetical protein
MRKFFLSHNYFNLITVLVLLLLFSSQLVVSAQPTQALNEDWRDTDYGSISRMMDSDLNHNVYILGYTLVGDYLVIKKFSPTGELLWTNTYNPAERLRGE